MIRITQIKCLCEEEIEAQIIKKLNISKKDLLSWTIHRRSIDARHQKILFSYTVDARVRKEKRFLKQKDVSLTPDETYHPIKEGSRKLSYRPIVVGFGPAGMFASLLLARQGYRPIVIERGSQIDIRKEKVQAFWQGEDLDEECNVQFGQGGAGAFSDGKLTTRSKDARARKVLEELVAMGADPDILIDAHPHIGTDGFVPILKNLQKTIEDLGVSFYYDTCLKDLVLEDGKLKKVITSKEEFFCESLILATGHSAVDTVKMCAEKGMNIENKPYAIGVRIEHKQKFIDQAILHERAQDQRFCPARYQVSMTASNQKGVYSFCMCPGGYVIPSSSQKEHLVINGMSFSHRDGENANSALLVQVNEKDYGSELFAGLCYQEEIEKKAFAMAKDYRACVQLAKDYLQGKVSRSFGTVKPTYYRGTTFVDLNTLFSKQVNDALHEGLLYFEKRIPGFSLQDAVLSAVESRSSSAVRILRDENLESNIEGIYPCGEGSGYAGGIMTSAIDGLKCAEKVIESFAKPL
ncbi:FAD-dependent protein [uncultured Faecalicoccus sp.]|uniref:NAD(P)/FAD-dependent oxidoreductase n=1 Tax=uncultured Faecalicoccus sp. TaxID=1971760 RepID=UPI0026151401|nr:hypothetical protein [uncultured Faecalicoccus sp.]